METAKMTGDTLADALLYALDKTGGAKPPVAIVNATGKEPIDAVKHSDNACNKLENTLNGVFNTILIRATRQVEETLGYIAHAARFAAPGTHIYVSQENSHGAPGLEKNLRRAFTDIQTISKFKCRTMVIAVDSANAATLQRWRDNAGIQKVKHNRGEFWSVPGVFSWDRPDPGSRLLLANLPSSMPGVVADLGCGNGLLSTALVKKNGVTELYAIDADARAVACCRRNLDERGLAIPAHTFWRDATEPHPDIPPLDYVVTNPPFHTQQDEDRELGQRFCNAALKMLKPGGVLYLVANRHLPYEAVLEKNATSVTLLADTDGFKVIRAAR